MTVRTLTAWILLLQATATAQHTLPVVFLQDSSRSTTIESTTRNGILYGPASDLAKLFRIELRPDTGTNAIVLRTEAYEVKLMPENRFVLITDRDRNSDVYQLPVAARGGKKGVEVPLEYFTPILNYLVAEDVTFDRSKKRLMVGHRKIVSQYDIVGLDLEEKTNGYLVRIKCSRKITDYESWLKEDGEYTWLYLTIANSRADVAAINRIKPAGILRKVLVFQSAASVQLTLKFRAQINTQEPVSQPGIDDILVALHPASAEQIAARKAKDYERALERERNKWKLDVVVIDAGHGGKDPGTIGVTRVKEKDVTLAIALKLGKLIQKQMKDVRVIYTRKTDEFIELYRRGQIANQAGGKLFISIHCNAASKKPNPANGFEIYVLRPGKTENALRIAERENEVVKFEEGYEQRYQQLTEENFILLTMTQNAYMKYSETFADLLRKEIGQRVGIANRGVKQAGFYVLVGASMPNVLVETGYLSNRHDERMLKNPQAQQKIAQSIMNGIRRFKTEYEKSLQEGKDIGAR